MNSFFVFWHFYVCANFGENWSRNATRRVHTDVQVQTSFIVCPMLYAVTMGLIIRWICDVKVNEFQVKR